MHKLLKATYKDGHLVLEEKLGDEFEGKTFQLMVFEDHELAVKKQRFFDFVKQHSFELPDDYQFNRDELYAR
ncbi:MAG: hypothetical protein ACRC8Y_20570 [Chroococcales cyanobacterium]